jgi:excisionase family DNA binding protein
LGIKNKARPPKVLLALSVNTLCNGFEHIRPEVIRAAIDSGELPAYRIGNKVRVLSSDAETWIRSHPRARIKKVKADDSTHA